MQKEADIVLSSNTVFTGLSDKPHPASIAIIGNRIAAIGDEEDIQPLIGPKTKVYRFRDQLIMPGFHDFHIHLMLGGLTLQSINLFNAQSEKEAVSMVRDFADANPDDPWIIGFKWDSSRWDDQMKPHRSALDHAIPDRPVVLFSHDLHFVWVNSKALEIAQINKDTPDPSFGIIEKDEFGEPTGILIEGAASYVTDYAFHFSDQQKEKLLERFLKEAARYGVTSVNDMFGSDVMNTFDDFTLLRNFDKNGQLTTRIHLYPALDKDLEKAKEIQKQYDSDKLKISGLKQFIDGVISSSTAYLVDGYADDPDYHGEPTHHPDELKKLVRVADKEGYSIRLHAIGEAAIRLALDAYEEAQKTNGVRDSRHAIEHVEVIHPDDIDRFYKLGVIASMQPSHIANTERELYTSRIGDKRTNYTFAWNTLQKAGAKLAFSTDFPVVPLNPLLQIHSALNRIDSGGKNAWNPQESVTLSEALKAYTYKPAYGTFREHELGTLESGKLADLVVLDRNLFELPSQQIADAQIDTTIMDGKVVFQKERITEHEGNDLVGSQHSSK